MVEQTIAEMWLLEGPVAHTMEVKAQHSAHEHIRVCGQFVKIVLLVLTRQELFKVL